MKFIRLALAVCVIALAFSAASAQTGGLSVQVLDSDGNPLPGATVTISNPLGYVGTSAVLSNKKGFADFPVLRPGEAYKIQVTFPGFSPFVQDDIRIRINDNQTLPIQMMSQVTERVKVVATTDVIDIDKTEASTKFSDSFIQDLPVPGRFYQNILTMAPGVNDADGDGNPNVHGSRNRDFKAVVSGISNVDPLTGQWMSRVNPNSIEEMEVITSGAGVEFGRAQGGFANIIQKQGSNEHEGVFEFYWRTSKIDGTGAEDFSNLPEVEFDWIQPSVQFSGPLLKDQLWYRFSHEYREIDQPVNTISGIEVITQEEATHSDQLTWQVSPRNKLAFQFSADPKDAFNLGVSNVVGPESSRSQKNSGETYSLTWTAPFSPKILVESQVAWQDLNFGLLPTTQGIGNDCLNDGSFIADAQCDNINVGERSGSYFRTWDDHRQRFTVTSKATLFGGRFWGMSHQFKLGLGVENERYFRALQDDPQVTYLIIDFPDQNPNSTTEENSPDPFGLALVSLSIPQTDDVRATSTNWHIYGEDQFRPRQNLSIRLGARVDRVELNSEGKLPFSPIGELETFASLVKSGEDEEQAKFSTFTGYEDVASVTGQLQDIICANETPATITNCLTGVENSVLSAQNEDLVHKRRNSDIAVSNTNFSPYLAASWTPWSNGKTAFGFTAGRYYNNLPLTLLLQELNPAGANLEYRVDLSTGSSRGQSTFAPALDVSVLNRDLKTPYNDEFTFSVEREIFPETTLEFRYVNRKFKDQIQDININRDTGDYGQCFKQLTLGVGGPIIPANGESVLGDLSTYLTDPYTLELYFDDDEGPGDGRIDDCAGDTEVLPPTGTGGNDDDPFGDGAPVVQRPDGKADLYYQNPFWGDVYEIGNVNSADYVGYELVLTRRQYRSWEMNASYTFSKAEGDGEDFFQINGDDPSLRDNQFGYQSYDQRHVVKLNATTITPWGVRLGSAVTWQSGLPYSLLQQAFSRDILPPVFTGAVGFGERSRTRQTYEDLSGNPVERNSARNDSYWNVDLKATKELTLGKGLNVQLSAEIFNAFNDGTYTVYNTFNETGRQVNGNNEAFRRFGRRWQLGVRLAF